MTQDLITSLCPRDLRSAFIEPPKPLDFVLPGLPVGCVGALVSPGGVGKSMLALQLAMQIAGGPDWIGLGKLGRGTVLYLPAEDPWPVLHQRLFALGGGLDAELRANVERNLRLIPLQGSSPNVLDSHWWEAIAIWGLCHDAGTGSVGAAGHEAGMRCVVCTPHQQIRSIPRSWRSAAGKPWFVGAGRQCALAGLPRHYDQERGAAAGSIGREEQASRAVWGKQK